ncbi:VOC family protein [Pilimelia columellifera]|uniref:VOC family protein n=1 Tax=Pilimelia columellifera subsp. columellifera TaxID=706583 RepID=A0ABN3N208_9ACTN
MRMIFINLPVKNLKRSMDFFSALGFSNNPEFTDETAAAMVIEENIILMLLTEPKFRDFITTEIADAHRTTEVLNCISAGTREEVDAMIATAIAAGGKPWQPTSAEGPMYGGSFQDPDGHVWEVLHMTRG